MNIQSSSISCYLPSLSTPTQQIIDKIFTEEEKTKKTYYSEFNNFNLTSFDYFAINYYGSDDISNLIGKVFYSNYNKNSAIINFVEIINNEIIIRLNYEKFNKKFNLNEQIIELNNSENFISYIILLKLYKSKPKSFYYNKIDIDNFEQNKNSGNFKIIKVVSKNTDFIIIEKNKISQKKQFYFYQKI